MFSKKKFTFVILITLVFSVGFAQVSSLYKSPKELFVITTKYFDIIFPQESKFSANLIAEKADSMYLEICEKLESSPYFRIPVVITPENDVLNAYYTCVPYNRIVLYDTLPTASSLAVFSETLVNVFYHELVHAVSLQKKNSFFKFASSIFGDVITTSQMITLPQSFVEGVTVSFESASGEGRINDLYSTHIILQSKIEDKFPSWKEVTGVRDVYPTGTIPYIFGGAFNFYLQNRFGLEKYAKFWEKANASFLSEAIIFKKIYGYKLKDIWKDFEDSIVISKKINDVNFDLINSSKKNIGRYQFLCTDKNNLYWFDKSKSSIFYLPHDKLSEKNPSGNKLLRLDETVTNFTVSNDSKFLVISQVNSNSQKNYVRIFDLTTKKFLKQKYKNLRESCIVKLQDGKSYLVGIKIQSSKNYLCFYDLVTGQEKFCKEFNLHTQIFYPIDIDNGNLAYLKKDKMNWNIEIFNPILEKNFQFELPKEVVLNSLTSVFEKDKIKLCFSYANKIPDGTLPRLGFIELSNGNFLQENSQLEYSVILQDDDISGGIYFPVVKDDSVILVAKYFDHDKILKISVDDLSYEVYKNNFSTSDKVEKSEEVFFQKENLQKKYYGIKYLGKGIFVPGSILSLERLSTTKFASISDLGFTYVTGEPTEQWFYGLSSFVNFSLEEAGYFVEVINSTFPALFTFDSSFTSKFNLSKWDLKNTLSVDYDLFLGKSSRYFNFLNTTMFQILQNSKTNYLFHNYFQILFTDYFNDGLGTLENNLFGYQLGIGLNLNFLWKNDFNEYKNINLFSYIFNLYFPILGSSQNLRFTYNLPTTANLVFFPDEENFCSFFVETTLFGVEIQKALSFLPLYFSRFLINAGYNSIYPNISVENSEHQLFSKLKLIFTPIYGTLTNLKLNLGFDVYYQIETDKFSFSLGGILDL